MKTVIGLLDLTATLTRQQDDVENVCWINESFRPCGAIKLRGGFHVAEPTPDWLFISGFKEGFSALCVCARRLTFRSSFTYGTRSISLAMLAKEGSMQLSVKSIPQPAPWVEVDEDVVKHCQLSMWALNEPRFEQSQCYNKQAWRDACSALFYRWALG